MPTFQSNNTSPDTHAYKAYSDHHHPLWFINKQQVTFNPALLEQPLKNGLVAIHLSAVFLCQMADAAGLEVDEGDAVRGEDEAVYDTEGAGVGEVLLRQDLAGAKEDLAHLGVAKESLDGGPFLGGEMVQREGRAPGRELREGRVDAQAPRDPGLDVGGAEGGVEVVCIRRCGRTRGQVRRGKRFVVQGPRRLGAVVAAPAELGRLGIGDGKPGRSLHKFAKSF